MKRALRLPWALLLVLPLSAMADTGPNETTYTQSTSTSIWNANAYGHYSRATANVGPQTMMVGDFGSCTLTLPYNCNPSFGTGTQADPYFCTTPPVLTNCGSGTPWVIYGAGVNYDTRTDYFVPAVAPAPMQPVPLSPWMPVGSALGAMLLVLWMRRRTG